MTRTEHLLIILAEECNEVAQRCSKALRFTLDEIQPGEGENNAERIEGELSDLFAVVEMLISADVLDHDIIYSKILMDRKREKVEKFLTYSEDRGTLEKEIVHWITDWSAPQVPCGADNNDSVPRTTAEGLVTCRNCIQVIIGNHVDRSKPNFTGKLNT